MTVETQLWSSLQSVSVPADSLPVRREPISKSCEITQADNLNCRRRLSRKAQCFNVEVDNVIKSFLA